MFAVDSHSDQPRAGPAEVGYCGVLELGVTVRAYDQQVSWVMADARVEMMHLKVRFAISFLKGEGAKLTLSVVEFAQKYPDPRRNDLAAARCAREYGWARLGFRLPGYAQ